MTALWRCLHKKKKMKELPVVGTAEALPEGGAEVADDTTGGGGRGGALGAGVGAESPVPTLSSFFKKRAHQQAIHQFSCTRSMFHLTCSCGWSFFFLCAKDVWVGQTRNKNGDEKY